MHNELHLYIAQHSVAIAVYKKYYFLFYFYFDFGKPQIKVFFGGQSTKRGSSKGLSTKKKITFLMFFVLLCSRSFDQ